MESSHAAQFDVIFAITTGSEPTSSCTLVLGRVLHHAGFSESMSSSPVGRTRAEADLPEPMDLCC